MKPVIIIAIAFVLLLVPSNAFSFIHDSVGGEGGRMVLGSDEPQNFGTQEFGELLLGVGFFALPIIGIIIIVLIIRKFRKKNRESKARTLEEIRKKKTIQGKVSLIFASIFWILVLIPWLQAPLGYDLNDITSMAVIVIFAFIFPFIAFVLTIIGIVKLLRRNNLSKNEKIEQLEDRLDKLETDEEKDSEEK